jgi:tripartite-type tricarboxylate transporter receptor subunit TctC
MVAGEIVARQPPDGLTLLVSFSGAIVGNKLMMEKLSFDPIDDLTPIGRVGVIGNALVVTTDLPFKSVKELVDHYKGKGETINYASWGVASGGHLAMESIRQQTGVKTNHVPYKTVAQIPTDMLAGALSIGGGDSATALPCVKSGRLRAIAVTSAERNRLLPDVPTAIEQGLSDFVVTSWQAVMAPAGMAPALLARVHGAVTEALKHPENVQRLNAIGFDVVGDSPDEYRRFQVAEIERWRRVVQTANIRAE